MVTPPALTHASHLFNTFTDTFCNSFWVMLCISCRILNRGFIFYTPLPAELIGAKIIEGFALIENLFCLIYHLSLPIHSLEASYFAQSLSR